jgi:hypothetical protein
MMLVTPVRHFRNSERSDCELRIRRHDPGIGSNALHTVTDGVFGVVDVADIPTVLDAFEKRVDEKVDRIIHQTRG